MTGLELYERRTYDVHVGEMSKVLELYSTLGWPALEAGGPVSYTHLRAHET